jgi:hypothetical protein
MHGEGEQDRGGYEQGSLNKAFKHIKIVLFSNLFVGEKI